MKKIIAAVLAFVMMLSLNACCIIVPDRSFTHPYDDEEPVATNPTAGAETEAAVGGFRQGIISGDTYESDYAGIGFTLPEGWSFYSAEEIRRLNCITLDLNEADYEEALKYAPFVYDMFVTDDDNGFINVFVVLEKDDALPLSPKDMHRYLNGRIPEVQAYLGRSGYSDVNSRIDTVTIDGRQMECIYSTCNLMGTPVYQCKLYFRCEDGVVAKIPVVAESEEKLKQLLDCIYLL